MARFRVYRMKDQPRQQFRWAPHVAGSATVKAKDYEPDGELEAGGDYDAWSRLRADGHAMAVGDLLETESGALRICKYVGFESASWWAPEPKPAADIPREQPPQAAQV